MDWLIAFFKSVVLVYWMVVAGSIALSLLRIRHFLKRISYFKALVKMGNGTCGEEDGEESSHPTEGSEV